MNVDYPVVEEVPRSPAFSAVAVLPAQARLVLVGGQNAVGPDGALVGGQEVGAQAAQTKRNVEAALAAAGCSWADVVRVTVHVKAGVDLRAAFGPFAGALQGRAAPPVVGVYQVVALARPDCLLEVAVEAVR